MVTVTILMRATLEDAIGTKIGEYPLSPERVLELLEGKRGETWEK
jgi:hypothetical protein